jgi:hypothetical protein
MFLLHRGLRAPLYIQLSHCKLSRPIFGGDDSSDMVTMVKMGGDLQQGCLADWLLTGLGQPQINP